MQRKLLPNNWQLNATFDFPCSLPGAGLLISPWLSKGIECEQYQNTVLRFVVDRMNAIYHTSACYLKMRVTTAPVLDNVLNDLTKYLEAGLPRPDGALSGIPTADTVPEVKTSRMRWLLNTMDTSAGTENARPVRYINELMSIYLSHLPGHPDSG